MNVLVTGADGLLGSNLVRLLIQKGYNTSVLLFYGTQSSTLDGLNITRFFGDITNPDTLDEAFSGQDVIVHAAASTAIWPARSASVRKINLEGTRNVIDKTLIHGVKKLIFIGSASSVNSKQTTSGKYPFPGARYKLDYIDTKHEALQMVMDAVTRSELPAVAVLPTFMIGPYDSKPGSGKMLLAFAKGKLKFYTGGGRNFIHVTDVAAMIENAIQYAEKGSQIVAANQNLTYREFFSIAARITGKPAPLFRIPCLMVKIAGWLGTVYGKFFHTEPVISYPVAKISCEKQFVENLQEVHDNLMIPVEKAIDDCYQWFRHNHYL